LPFSTVGRKEAEPSAAAYLEIAIFILNNIFVARTGDTPPPTYSQLSERVRNNNIAYVYNP
jgi:hypothetical protein